MTPYHIRPAPGHQSTLLSALSGKLAPQAGQRIEGDGLALGTFTQDLAQDLDQEGRAVDVVTNMVRPKVCAGPYIDSYPAPFRAPFDPHLTPISSPSGPHPTPM